MLVFLPATHTLVLTINNRLVQQLNSDITNYWSGKQVVSERPHIISLKTWLTLAIDELAFTHSSLLAEKSLGKLETELLWADVISKDKDTSPLLDIRQAARLSVEADTIIDEWMLDTDSCPHTKEMSQFLRWRELYRNRSKSLGMEDFNQRYRLVLEALHKGNISFPKHLVLYGFTHFSPRFLHLLNSFTSHGVEIACLKNHPANITLEKYTAPDHNAEWQAAASWAAKNLLQNTKGSYAIVVVSSLDKESHFAQRALHNAFRCYNFSKAKALSMFSISRPLGEWPAVRAAFSWLNALAVWVSEGSADTTLMGSALLSGHCVNDVKDKHRYAIIDRNWREKAVVRVSQEKWNEALKECPDLLESWKKACKIWLKPGVQTTLELWVDIFRDALASLSYPGEQPFEGVISQVAQQLNVLLDRCSKLSQVLGPIDGKYAVKFVENAAQSLISCFPEKNQNRLEILELQDAQDGKWDGLWMLSFTDNVLPAVDRINPFLSPEILRKAGIPHSTADYELKWTEEIISELCHFTSEVIVSYPLTDGEQKLFLSPLVSKKTNKQRSITRNSNLPLSMTESLIDDQGPGLDSETLSQPGGIDILEIQARNPLWAFVKYRLGGRVMNRYTTRTTIDCRGKFLHRALEILWNVLGSQTQLLHFFKEKKIEMLIKKTVLQSAHEVLADYSDTMIELESTRAETLLKKWLDLETQRASFTIEDTEVRCIWSSSTSLALKLRLDRIDRLQDGSLMVVDYKTGATIPDIETSWFRARPINLQIPFYACVLRKKFKPSISGLMFAHIHTREIQARGITCSEIGVEEIGGRNKVNKIFYGYGWPQILDAWSDIINKLADEYVQGCATNMLFNTDDLRYCDALPFLRLHFKDDTTL